MSDGHPTDQSKIEERLRSALKRLDLTSQFLIQSLFGILGCNGKSSQKVAQHEEVSKETIEGLQADALRALMGYGPKSPKGKIPSSPFEKGTFEQNGIDLDLDIPEILN